MKNNFTILWNGSKVFVDLKEDAKANPVYVLYAPKKKRGIELTSRVDDDGVEHWMEKGKETAETSQIGALIEMAMYQHSSHWGI